jgi:DNA-binding NarL/FixJ family response regulator
MPVMNGFEAARELRKVLPDTKIILFTVEEGSEVERMAREAGVDAIVLKSQTPELISRARSLLDPEEGERNSGELRNAS